MTVCENCGMAHEPDDTDACIEGHGADPIQITVPSEPTTGGQDA